MNPNTFAEILQLIQVGLTTFGGFWNIIHHPTNPAPVSVAPQVITALQSTPGLTEAHKTVIASAVNAAATTAA